MNEATFAQGIELLTKLQAGCSNGTISLTQVQHVADLLVTDWAAAATATPVLSGLVVEMNSEELRQHLDERATYHAEKIKHYERQAAANEEAQRSSLSEAMQSNNPVQSLRQSAQQHRQRCGFFAVLAAHVVDDVRYRLSEQDFTRLELLDRYL